MNKITTQLAKRIVDKYIDNHKFDDDGEPISPPTTEEYQGAVKFLTTYFGISEDRSIVDAKDDSAASDIHYLLEDEYDGITRTPGIWTATSAAEEWRK